MESTSAIILPNIVVMSLVSGGIDIETGEEGLYALENIRKYSMDCCDILCRLKDTRSRKCAKRNLNGNYPEKNTNSSKYYSRRGEYL